MDTTKVITGDICWMKYHNEEKVCSSDSRELGQDEEDVQRVTLRAGHFLYGDNINQTPWSSQE